MSVITLGIDPGKTGALAWLDAGENLLHVEDMPDLTGAALGARLRDLIHAGGESFGSYPGVAWVEKVHAMPKQGVKSVWTFAEGYGVLLGVLGALGIPVRLVTPTQWKGTARLSADKNASRQRACELWPQHSQLFARVKDADRAEASLIGLHGINADHTKENTAA